MKALYLVIIVIISTNVISQDCINILKNNLANLNKLNFTNPIYSLGFGLNDMGNYDLCLNSTDNRFYVLHINISIESYTGICLPKECSGEENLRDFKKNLSKLIQIDENEIDMIDSIKENDESREWNVGKVIFLILIMLYIMFFIGIYVYISYKENNSSIPYQSLNNDQTTENESSTRLNIQEKSIIDNFIDNYDELFKLRNDNDLKVFDGMKVISCILIIVLQIFIFSDNFSIKNPDYENKIIQSGLGQYIFNFYYIINTFFGLSGFLFSYIAIKNISYFKKTDLKAIVLNLVLRLMRIWPCYIFVFIVYWNFFGHFVDGPLSGYVYNKEISACNIEWPFIVTLTSNFYYNKESFGCLHHIWYISNDFQYFIIGTILLVIYAKNKKFFVYCFIFINSLFLGLEIAATINYKPGVNIYDYKLNNFNQYYTGIYSWSFPYFLGFLMGMLYGNYKKRMEKNKFSKLELLFDNIKESFWLSASYYLIGFLLISILTLITCWSFNKWNLALIITYNVIFKKLISIGFFLLCIPLLLGNLYFLGGWLGSTTFTYLSKLNYSCYLVSPLVIRYAILNMKIGIIFNFLYILIISLSVCVISYTISILLNLLIEFPFIKMRETIKKKLFIKRPTIKSEDFLKPIV